MEEEKKLIQGKEPEPREARKKPAQKPKELQKSEPEPMAVEELEPQKEQDQLSATEQGPTKAQEIQEQPVENQSPKQLHILVAGKVQGVFFRASAQRKALELGLVGWVRNLSDGRVEIKAEGTPGLLDQFKKWCQQGPPQAYVVELEVHESEESGEFTDFQILYS